MTTPFGKLQLHLAPEDKQRGQLTISRFISDAQWAAIMAILNNPLTGYHQWTITHAGQSVTKATLPEVMLAMREMRTPAEKLQGAVRVMKAVDAMLEEPEPIEGLGSITNDDDGFLSLRFKDEDAAQQFMRDFCPTVEANDMPPWPDDPAPIDRAVIKEVLIAHGFTVKEGQTDLKSYVYEAAEALLALRPNA
ncbi:MAG: hypothetical protein V4621_07905 [Pseudomonadota bacterium]